MPSITEQHEEVPLYTIIDWMEEERQKCIASPYYFAITYLEIETPKGKQKFTTILTEEQFNSIFNKLAKWQ